MDDQDFSGSDELQQRLQEASQLSEEGHWAEAFELLLKEEEQHPSNAMLLCMLGVAAGQVDEVSGMAYDFFRRCLAEQPSDPFVLVPLGVGLARYDDPDAEGVLRLAALSAPDLALTRFHYGAYLAREGQLELARTELEAARAADPDDAHIGRELGALHLLAGRLDAGLDELERALAIAPEDGELHLFYGLALLQAGRDEEAAESLYQAAAEAPQEGEFQLLGALACAAQEWWDQAWEALARADHSVVTADPLIQHEVEAAVESGSEASRVLLREELGPSVLRLRLLEHR